MRFDTVVTDATVVTMNPERDVIRGWVGIVDGSIEAVVAGDAPRAGDDASRTIDARGGILHPGFVSAHQHSMDALGRASRGGAEPFFEWLFSTYYGTVLAYTAKDARRAAALTAHDLVRAGITTVLDCWGVGDAGGERSLACLDATLEVARSSGLRWIVAPMVGDRLPASWSAELEAAEARGGFRRSGMVAPTADALRFAGEALDRVGRVRDNSRDDLVEVWVAPELPEMASDALIAGLVALAAARGSGFTTHLCPSPESAAGDGPRAVVRLDRLGAFAGRTVGAHLVSTTEADRAVLSARRVGAAHCPTSTMYGSGRHSSVGELREARIATGLGLDNATLNTTADMVAEMRHALLFDRVAPSGTVRLTASDVLAMATIEGAAALGMSDRIGSIEVGKRADLVLLDTSGRHWRPERPPELGIVLQSRADDIREVLVDGERVRRAKG